MFVKNEKSMPSHSQGTRSSAPNSMTLQKILRQYDAIV